MIPTSLKIALFIGIASGAVTGLILADVDSNQKNIQYVKGPSLSIFTDKSDYQKGESVNITLVNSGSVPLSFLDKSHGFKITGLAGMLIFSPWTTSDSNVDTTDLKTDVILKPKESHQMSWNQQNNDGDQVFDGIYKISVYGFDDKGMKIEQTKIIDIIEIDLTFGS